MITDGTIKTEVKWYVNTKFTQKLNVAKNGQQYILGLTKATVHFSYNFKN